MERQGRRQQEYLIPKFQAERHYLKTEQDNADDPLPYFKKNLITEKFVPVPGLKPLHKYESAQLISQKLIQKNFSIQQIQASLLLQQPHGRDTAADRSVQKPDQSFSQQAKKSFVSSSQQPQQLASSRVELPQIASKPFFGENKGTEEMKQLNKSRSQKNALNNTKPKRSISMFNKLANKNASFYDPEESSAGQ